MEALEKRLALAVDVVFEAPTGGAGEDWITIVANHQDSVTGLPAANPADRVGSNVFFEMASTPTSDLFVADNASFTDRITVSNVDGRFDHIYVYNGQAINAADPNADGQIDGDEVLRPNINLPVVSPGYPFIARNDFVQTASLRFGLRSEGIDWNMPVSGEIHLNNATREIISFTNGGQGTVLTVTSGPGAGDVNPITRLSVVTGNAGGLVSASQAFLTFTASSAYFDVGGAGALGEVTLENFTYDADTDHVVTVLGAPTGPGNPTNFAAEWFELVSLDDVGAVVSVLPQIQLFDPTQFEYVPGTLSGVLDVGFDSLQPITFQVQESGTGVIPLSFSNARDAEGTVGTLTWVSQAGNPAAQEVRVEGTFDSATGVVSFRFTLNGDTADVAKLFAPNISSASLAVRYLNPAGTATPSAQFNLVEDISSNTFTLFPGHTFSRGLTVDFVNPGSTVTIESPIVTEGTSSGVIELSATTVTVNAPTRADTAFRVPAGGNSAFGTITEQVTVNAALSSPSYDIRLANDPATDTVRRARLMVSQTGSISSVANVLDRAPTSLTAANQLFVEIVDGDAFLEGRVVATNQSYLISSPQMQPDATRPVLGDFPDFAPYYLTTRSQLTGVDVGSIEANTLAITLANDTFVLPAVPPSSPYTRSTAFSVLDVSTDVVRMRVQASDRVNDPLQMPFPYIIDVREANDVFVDAVAASALPISVTAEGSVDLLGSLISAGDITITAAEEFVVSAPIQTSFGQIKLIAPEIEVRNSIRVLDTVQDERDTDISLTATDGSLLLNDAVAAINRVELTQRGAGGNILGDARIIADIVEIDSVGEVEVRTNASRVIARTTGDVFIDELDYGVFEVRDSGNVTLIANGYDQVATVSDDHPAYDSGFPRRALNSPALYADVYGTNVLTVSAPNGSIDVFHRGATALALGDITKIADGLETPMRAAGSVTIRSDLASITVNDAPTSTSSSRSVRLATTAPLVGAPSGPDAPITYRNNSPGVVSSTLTGVRIARNGVQGVQFDNVDVTTLRPGDRILVKNGIQRRNEAVVSLAENGIYEVTRVVYPIGDTSFVQVDLRRATDADTTADLAEKHYVRVLEGGVNRGKVFTADGSTRFGSEAQSAVATAVQVGQSVTITTAVAHGLMNGQQVQVEGVGEGYDGTWKISVPSGSPTQFTYQANVTGLQASNAGSVRGVLVPVYNGWGEIQTPDAFGDLSFANVFDNTASPVAGAVGGGLTPTPVAVFPITPVTGFVPARVVTPTALSVGELAGEYKPLTGTIEASISGVQIPPIDGVLVDVGDLVLVRYGALRDGSTTGEIDVASPGLYRVVDVGATGVGGTSSWRLERYAGLDEDGDGGIDRFYTGRVAIDEGTLRTSRTGEMFQVGLVSLGHSPLRYQEVAKYLFDANQDYDSVLNYKVDIGSENPRAEVIFTVTTNGSTNNATGSFGRMLSLYQDNSAFVERTLEPQVSRFRISPGVTRVDLQQALPDITRPINIQATSRTYLDGSRITQDSNGGVVRGGSVLGSLGPVRASQASVSRRILRPGVAPVSEVWGLSFLDGADGSVVSGLAFGNFLNGGAIHLNGASNVLLRDLVIGSNGGLTAANKYGVRLAGDVAHTTISGVTIVSSSENGIHFDATAQEVHIVGSTIGTVGRGNKVGIYDASTNVVGNFIGAAAQVGTSATFRSGTVISTTEISVRDARQSGLVVTVTTDANHGFSSGDVVYIRGIGFGYDGEWTVTRLTDTTFSYQAATSGLLQAFGGTADRTNRATVRFSADDATQVFRAGLHLYDDRNDVMREILSAVRVPVTIGGESVDFFDVTVVNTPTGSLVGVGDLQENDSTTLQFIHRVTVTRGSDQVTLPASLHPGDIFLGQSVSSLQSLFAPGTTVAGLITANGITTITLSAAAVGSGQTGLLLGTPIVNNVSENSDGIILDSFASRLVNTAVIGSIFDGIRIETTNAAGGIHVLGDSQGVQTAEVGGPSNPILSTQNLVVHGNGLAGIRFTDRAFATLPDLTPLSLADDYREIDAFLRDRVRLRGNYLGFDPVSQSEIGNGRDGTQNILVSDTVGTATGASRADEAEIRFVLLEDSGVNSDGRVEARLRWNLPDGLDSQFNRHAEGTDSDTSGSQREVTAPRRPVVRG